MKPESFIRCSSVVSSTTGARVLQPNFVQAIGIIGSYNYYFSYLGR
jgi:hypothetical protein